VSDFRWDKPVLSEQAARPRWSKLVSERDNTILYLLFESNQLGWVYLSW